MFGLFVKKQVAVPDDTIVLTGTVERIGAANVSYDMLHFVLVLKEGATVHRFKTASWDIAEKISLLRDGDDIKLKLCKNPVVPNDQPFAISVASSALSGFNWGG